MKAFLEEYGMIVIVCIAVAVLIALAVWTGKKSTKASTGAIEGFTNKASDTLKSQGVTMTEGVEDVGSDSGSGSSDSE